ncbi:MAG: exodeoxyribonuclease V subunit gamma, partial [Rhodocyclaceae bacterium]|nr:exodeoxyribonuclease V subunit gamma [Rhodocyclaceae bacterium]
EVGTRQVLDGGDGSAAVLQELAAMARRGELPAGGFEGLAQAALFEPLPDLQARAGAAFARWPEAVPDQPFEFEHAIDGCPLRVEDWVGDLRRNPDGGLGRVVILASDLVVNNTYRLDHAIPAWVTHLAAQLAAGPVTTELIAKVGERRLLPLDPDEAAAHLQVLMAAWHAGMRRPLPLAVKTGFAWLAAMPPDADPERVVDKAVAAARAAFDGNPPHAIGERDGCAALRRAWPDFDDLVADGEFARLVVALLAPLRAAIDQAAEAAQ